MAQGKRAYGVGIAGKGHHPDEIVRPSLEVFAVSQDEFPEDFLDDFEPIQLRALIDELLPHGARAVNDHFDGNSLAHIPHFFPALLGTRKADGEQNNGDDTNNQGQMAQAGL